jgi:cell division protein FtsL
MDRLLWILFYLLVATLSGVLATAYNVRKLAKSLEDDNSKVQSLLAEIKERLDSHT